MDGGTEGLERMFMELTILCDNHTLIDRYYLGEPALSFYIEDGEKRILFDTGYSDVFLRNAEKMDIDLSGITDIVFSHGHNDHTGGFTALKKAYDLTGICVHAHPDTFKPKRHEGLDVGTPYHSEDLFPALWAPSAVPVQISEHLLFLGEIPRTVPFEKHLTVGTYLEKGRWRKDPVRDDSALVYHQGGTLTVITGCSHSGICNIISYAEELFHTDHVTDVIGGFHLMEDEKRIRHTAGFLRDHVWGSLVPCHCISLQAKHVMMQDNEVLEAGSGMRICWHENGKRSVEY